MFALLTALFSGPATTVTGWFTSFFGKIIGVLAIVALIGGMGTSVYFSWTHDIKVAEDAKLAAAQAQELAKAKEAEIAQLKDLQDKREKAQTDLQAVTNQTNQNSAAVRAWLDQQPVADDRPVSNVISETFDRLYGKAQ